MRVLLVVDSLKVGGAEMLMLNLVDFIAAQGGEATVAYFTPGPLENDLKNRGIEPLRLSKHGLRDPFSIYRMFRLIKTWKPDIVHTHLTKSDIVGHLAARLAGIPGIVSLHNNDPWREKKSLSWLYKRIVSSSKACIAVSENVAGFTYRTGGYRAGGIEVVSNGVNVDLFDKETVRKMDLSEWGIPAGRPLVAKIGRLSPQKDHVNFLRAIAEVKKVRPELFFMIVGTGDLIDSLEKEASTLGIDDEHLAFTGVIREMPELLATIDTFVLASMWEGLPVALLEAMSMSLPCVCTNVGGIPNVIEDGFNGRLVPPSSPKDLSAAIVELADDETLRRTMGRHARDTVVSQFSGSTMLKRTWSIYNDLR